MFEFHGQLLFSYFSMDQIIYSYLEAVMRYTIPVNEGDKK